MLMMPAAFIRASRRQPSVRKGGGVETKALLPLAQPTFAFRLRNFHRARRKWTTREVGVRHKLQHVLTEERAGRG